MRAAVAPVHGRAAIARAAASGAAPPPSFASEGDPTTHGASCGAGAQAGKRKRDEEPMVQALSLLPTPVVAAPSQRAALLAPAPSSTTPRSAVVGGLMIVSRQPLPSREASAAPGAPPAGVVDERVLAALGHAKALCYYLLCMCMIVHTMIVRTKKNLQDLKSPACPVH
eukprot:scaffold1847_cov131-Isochrysis_galbana.AAC.2